jgi:hypothetical protein
MIVHLRPGAGGIWTIGRDGATVAVRDAKGLRYLRLLVRQPGVEISSLDLATWVAGHPGAASDGPAEEIIDRQALRAYRDRLTDLDDEITEAEQWSDPERVAALKAEREALLDQVLAATGRGGRSRNAGSSAEKARVAVRKSVAASIDRIEGVDASLGRLLRDTVRTGGTCCYDPDPSRPVRWVLDD